MQPRFLTLDQGCYVIESFLQTFLAIRELALNLLEDTLEMQSTWRSLMNNEIIELCLQIVNLWSEVAKDLILKRFEVLFESS